MSNKKAQLLQNPNLQKYLVDNKEALRNYLLEVETDLLTKDVNTEGRFGKIKAKVSLELDLAKNPPVIANISNMLESCFPGYTLTGGSEIFVGRDAPLMEHTDSGIFVNTGRSMALQLWVLLDFFERDNPDATPEENLALECVLPPITGVMYPGDTASLTPTGIIEFPHDEIIGGASMVAGDILLFSNNVRHRKPPGTKGVLRFAMAQRFTRTQEPDDVADKNFVKWLAKEMRVRPELDQRWAATNPYYERMRPMLADLDEDIDLSKCTKIDLNDYEALGVALSTAPIKPL